MNTVAHTSAPDAALRLKKNEDRRLRAGHLWVFSNEVDTRATPLSAFEPGQMATVESAGGRPLGSAYVNPGSLICARLISRRAKRGLDRSLIAARLRNALALRQRLFAEPYYRLAYGEADALPGLVVDRFGEVVVVQITTAGMERVRESVLEALLEVVAPQAIVLRNDSPLRALEGLESYTETPHGETPAQLEVRENGLRFQVQAGGGQKTGWFYDHRVNRRRLQAYVKDARVLDVFSYVGAFGLHAAAAGAESVLCVDSSAAALDQLQDNADRLDLAARVDSTRGDAFDTLTELRERGTRFDVVVVDPPAFIKRRKQAAQGLQAYRRLNELAMRVLDPGGVLLSASCSYHLPRERLRQVLLQGARRLDRSLTLIEQGHQGPDHPVHPAIEETDYLKAYFCRLLPGG